MIRNPQKETVINIGALVYGMWIGMMASFALALASAVDSAFWLTALGGLLFVSADIALEDAVARVNALGGIAIPAHIDRPANGLIALLGFVPPGLNAAALEISPNISADAARARFHLSNDVALICSSDAHWLDAIGLGVTEFELEGPRNVAGLAKALREKRYRI